MPDYNLSKTAVQVDAALNQVDTNTANIATKFDDSDAVTPVTGGNKLLTQADAGFGAGDMLKSVYDTNDNGIVDNAALVNNLSVQTAVPGGAVFTDTVYDDSLVLKDTDALSTVSVGNKLITQSDIVTTRYPVVTKNKMPAADRFPTADDYGTGSSTETTETDVNGIKNGILAVDTGALGRSFYSRTLTLEAGQWYAISFEITAQNVSGTLGAGIKNVGGTAIIDQGNIDISIDEIDINAGGIGRYTCAFMSLLGGTIGPRIGVGLTADNTSGSFTFKNIQFEKINSERGLICTPYVFPNTSFSFSYLSNLSLDENKRISEYPVSNFNTVKYSNVIVVGDSRSDEIDDIPAQINILYKAQDNQVNMSVHAKGGWKTSDIIGPTIVDTISHNYLDVLDGKAMRSSLAVPEQENQISNLGYAYDTLLICFLGANDISVAAPLAAVSDAMINIDLMATAAVARGMDVIITDNNPFNAHASWTATKQQALEELNRSLMNYCAENGHMFVSVYQALGDSTDPDKLSDGLDTSPDYSDDDLHLNLAGAIKVAQIIKAQMDANRG